MNQHAIRIAVIGAGHGGKAMAAEMASRGYRVTLYNRTYDKIEIIDIRGGIELQTEDGHSTFAHLHLVTADIGEALAETNLIMVVVPASGHRDVALSAAPYLRDDHIVVLHPGRTGGALEFEQTLLESGCRGKPIICEAETFLFAARSTGPAEVRIFRTKFSVPISAFPATRSQEALAMLSPVYSQFILAKNVLYTSLNNMGAICSWGRSL